MGAVSIQRKLGIGLLHFVNTHNSKWRPFKKIVHRNTRKLYITAFFRIGCWRLVSFSNIFGLRNTNRYLNKKTQNRGIINKRMIYLLIFNIENGFGFLVWGLKISFVLHFKHYL